MIKTATSLTVSYNFQCTPVSVHINDNKHISMQRPATSQKSLQTCRPQCNCSTAEATQRTKTDAGHLEHLKSPSMPQPDMLTSCSCHARYSVTSSQHNERWNNALHMPSHAQALLFLAKRHVISLRISAVAWSLLNVLAGRTLSANLPAGSLQY